MIKDLKGLKHVLFNMGNDVKHQDQSSIAADHDIQQSTRELEKSLQRLSAIINNSVAGIITFDGQGKIKTINHAASEIFNITPDTQLRQIHEYIPHICFPSSENARKLCTGTPLEETLGERLEGSAICEKGDQVIIEYSISRINIDGEDEYTAIINDISERKLAETDLIAARYIAEEASQAKSDFLSNMSHELRTPLNAVLGFAQLLEMNDLGEPHNSNVKEILQAGRHLLGLINQVLDLSRIESGRLDLNNQDVGVTALINQALSLIQNSAKEKQIDVKFDHGGFNDLLIHTDPLRLRQVLLNLLSNAVKYNRAQGKIFVKITRPDDASVSIAIEDTGIGIEVGHLEKIFKPFERVNSELFLVEGTGIGLSISHHLIHMMGGSIQVSSEPGKGSCFSVILPC